MSLVGALLDWATDRVVAVGDWFFAPRHESTWDECAARWVCVVCHVPELDWPWACRGVT